MRYGYWETNERTSYSIWTDAAGTCRPFGAYQGIYLPAGTQQNTPSIGTLLDIIQCLGTTPAEFFTDEEPEQIVFKNEDFFTKVNEDKHNIIEWVVPNAQKDSMEPVRLTLKAGGSSDIMQPHSGEEFGYLIKGTVKIYYGGKSHMLHAGESFYLKAGKKHYIENPGSRDAVLIWVSTPPSF